MDKGAKNDKGTPSLQDLLERSKNGGALVVLSEDRVQRERVIEEIAAQSPKPHERQLRDAKVTSVRQLQSEIASPSLFTPFTITVLKDLQECNAEQLRDLLQLLEGPIHGNLLIFLGSKLPSNSVFIKRAHSLGILLQIPKLTDDTLERWAMNEFSKRGLSIEKSTLGMLTAAAEGSADLLFPMIEKLDLYLSGTSVPVRPEDVQMLFVIPVEAHEFELAEAVLARDVVRVELLITTLIATGKSPFTIIPLLARTFANYAVIALALRRNTPSQEIRERLNISSWAYNRYLPTAKRYPPRAFTAHARALLLADSKIKNRSLGPELILSELLRSLAILA